MSCLSVRFILLLLFCLLLSACAQQHSASKRYLWPIGNENPKIEYLRSYQADLDVQQQGSALSKAILGVDPPTPLFVAPHGIASDGQGKIFVTDVGLQQVLICDLRKGEVRSLRDSDGERQLFSSPLAVALDDQGGGYVADTANQTIYRFSAAERVIAEFGKGELERPNGMVFDPRTHELYVADTLHHQLAVFSATGELLRRIGKRGAGPGEFNFPLDVDLTTDGQLVVLDSLNARVQILETDGRFVRMFGERGTAIGSFQIPKALAVDGFGHVYVTDSQAHRFVIFDLQGDYLLTIGARSVLSRSGLHPGGFNLPQGIDADPDGGIWIVDSLSRLVHRFQYLSPGYLQLHPIGAGDIVPLSELQ